MKETSKKLSPEKGKYMKELVAAHYSMIENAAAAEGIPAPAVSAYLIELGAYMHAGRFGVENMRKQVEEAAKRAEESHAKVEEKGEAEDEAGEGG